MVRRICGPKKMMSGQVRSLVKFEMVDILKEEYLVRTIKLQRIRWYGHLKRMQGEKVGSKSLQNRYNGKTEKYMRKSNMKRQ